MEASEQPTAQVARLRGLLRTGPRAIALRLIDQLYRRATGAPLWRLSAFSPQLALGGQHYARGYARLRARGISAIINMREPHFDDRALGIGGERHLHLPTIDNTPPSLRDLARGVAFVQAERERGGAVYIHCGVGVGRAPTMAAACLIADGLPASEALKRIQAVRPFVHLTPGQARVLEEFARSLAEAAAPAADS